MFLFNEARYQRVERGKGALGTMEQRLAERLTENRNRSHVQPYLPVTLAASSIRLPEVRLPSRLDDSHGRPELDRRQRFEAAEITGTETLLHIGAGLQPQRFSKTAANLNHAVRNRA